MSQSPVYKFGLGIFTAVAAAAAYTLVLPGSTGGALALGCLIACLAPAVAVTATAVPIFLVLVNLLADRFQHALTAADANIYVAAVGMMLVSFRLARKSLWSQYAPLPFTLRRFFGSGGRALLLAVAAAAVLAMTLERVPLRDSVLWAVAAIVMRAQVPTAETARSSLRALTMTAAITLFSLTAMCAIVEAGARVIVFPEGRSVSLYTADAKYLFRLRPGARGGNSFKTGPESKEFVEYVISEQGLRDDYVPLKPPGEFRVLLIGDSFTFGSTVEFEQTIGRNLQRILATRHPTRSIRVINMGAGGFGPWQERGLLRDEGFDFEPDLVVHQLYLSNDIGNELSAVGKTLETYYEVWEQIVEKWRLNAFARFRIETALFNYSDAYAALTRIAGRQRITRVLGTGTRILPDIEPIHRTPSTARSPAIEVDIEPWYPELNEGWELLVKSVTATAEECEQRGVAYAVFNVPCMQEVVDEFWAEHTLLGMGHRYVRGKADRLLAFELDTLGIDRIPLKERITQYPDPKRLYQVFDGHLSPEGNRITAELLADYIKEQGVLTPTYPTDVP